MPGKLGLNINKSLLNTFVLQKGVMAWQIWHYSMLDFKELYQNFI